MRNAAARLDWSGVRVPTSVLLRLATSFILALLLWGWVTTQQDPTVPRTFADLPLQDAQLPEPLEIVGDLTDATARVAVEGPRSLVQDLATEDLIARLDLSQVDGPGTYTVPIRVAAPDAIRVERVTPRQISILVDETVTRSFHLDSRALPVEDSTRRVGNIAPDVSEVTVSGPKQFVDSVTQVVLPIDINKQTSDFSAAFNPVAENGKGEQITGVQIRPEQVQASVEVDPLGRSVPVLIQSVGSPAEGYEVADRAVNPATVLLDGPRDVLGDIVSVSTEPVNIEGASSPSSSPVGLRGLPAGVHVVDPPDGKVVVVIQIQRRGVAQTLTDQTVAVTDLGPGLEAQVNPRSLSVEIFATEETLATLKASEIVPRVSAARLGPGTYRLPLVVSVPAGVQWIRTEPTTVDVTITIARGTPGATPQAGAG